MSRQTKSLKPHRDHRSKKNRKSLFGKHRILARKKILEKIQEDEITKD